MNVSEGKVIEIIKRGLELDQNVEIDADTDLEKWGLNSIKLVTIMVMLEEEFDIEFDDDYKIELFSSGKKIRNYILDLMKKKQ